MEIERILRVANLRWKVCVILGMGSLRRSEVQNLTVNDIRFDKNYIHVKPKTDTATTWSWRIKDHHEAIVPLPPEIYLPDMILNVHKIFLDLIDSLPEGQPYLVLSQKTWQNCIKLRDAGKLSYERRGNPWSCFSRDYPALLQRASVEHKRFHDLRGTFATTMAMNGMSLTETQRLMRHSSPATTAEYYIAVDDAELVKKTNNITRKCYVSNTE